ncbi:MAG: non-hydrolyzing UDP-N-acetylglucosamine 2-epimerase [Cryomorphaceae bacterium]
MEQRRIWIVIGTRPNFIKVTQFKKRAEKFDSLSIDIVHTGQHYDEKMARVFFDQFGLSPDVFLNVKPDHPGRQIAETILRLTDLFEAKKPDFVLVVGDVNSTLAAAIAANKCNIPIGHLESGLRSFDREMPEEHNRLVADALSDIHFVTEDSGLKNLRNEGKPERGIAFVGNTMIDTLVAFQNEIDRSDILERIKLPPGKFALVTIHRPSNVDSKAGMEMLLNVLRLLDESVTAVFPIHPRTEKNIAKFGLKDEFERLNRLVLLEPLSYFDFQKLVKESAFVLTDSGGIQEETTFLKKPCLTLRPNTERPSTTAKGTNVLLPFDVSEIEPFVADILNGNFKSGEIPAYWDGQATERVLKRIEDFFNGGF